MEINGFILFILLLTLITTLVIIMINKTKVIEYYAIKQIYMRWLNKEKTESLDAFRNYASEVNGESIEEIAKKVDAADSEDLVALIKHSFNVSAYSVNEAVVKKIIREIRLGSIEVFGIISILVVFVLTMNLGLFYKHYNFNIGVLLAGYIATGVMIFVKHTFASKGKSYVKQMNNEYHFSNLTMDIIDGELKVNSENDSESVQEVVEGDYRLFKRHARATLGSACITGIVLLSMVVIHMTLNFLI